MTTNETADPNSIAEQERARLYSHFQQAPFPIVVLRGSAHRIELANEAALRIWQKPASVVGLPLARALPELEGQPFIELLDGVLRTGIPFEGKETLARIARATDGVLEDVYFNFVYSPLRDRVGAVDGVLVSAFDVTSLVAARRRAEESELSLRTLVDSIPELAWAARADGFIDFYNRRWYEYTGTTPEQMQGWGWESVHDPAMLDDVKARWQASLATGESFEMEFPLKGADGMFRWFLTRVVPLRASDGTILRWFGTNTNVHEQREARRRSEALLEEVSRQAAEMERAVREMREAKNEAENRLAELRAAPTT